MKPVKPSVPKVVITTGKPKVPDAIVKTTEGIATKQEQVHLVQEKVNGIVAAVKSFSYSILTLTFS